MDNVIDLSKYRNKSGYLFTEDELVEVVIQWCEMIFDEDEMVEIAERLKQMGFEE